MFEISTEFQYFILFSMLLLVPKILLRYQIPTALTALILGFATTALLGWFQDDQLILMLSRLGITSLFLFAGMEVDVDELKEDGHIIGRHLINVLFLIFALGFVLQKAFDLNYRIALILSLGLMTPSTGFILNSLKGYSLTEHQEKWVRSKAIAIELIAILLLFFTLQTESLNGFLISSGSLIAMISILPLAFRFFLKVVAPFAPDSEVSFLILIALLCGVITTKLGTYYLVGAFIVGMTAGRFKHFIANENSKTMLYSVSFFFSFFVPFYFYKAGLNMSPEMFSLKGFGIGLAFLVVALPLRFIAASSTIFFFLKDSWKNTLQISLPLLPTLIFGLVIATILKERFQISAEIFSGLIIYTLGSSVFPWFFLKKLPPEPYDTSMISDRSSN